VQKHVVQERAVQDRAVQTRQDLLTAARLIFARDGFEVARLQDIAEAAGKTRGALYAHFKDKEDLFFAIVEQDMIRDTEVYNRILRPDSSFEEKVEVLTSQLMALIRDRNRVLLYLEFKMYAIRHPHRQKRLADLHVAICVEGSSRKIQLIPELHIADDKTRRRVVASFGSALDGLALYRYFDPVGLPDETIQRKVEQMVRDRLLGVDLD
jgi:AcrR family transcriptional regulator